MATLQSVIDRAISVAATKGLTGSKRVTVVNEIGGAEIMLVVSYNEPHSVEAPLNLIWINGDPAHPDYKVARKRASRVGSNGFIHTWSTITEFSQLAAQFWDVPQPDDNDHNLHNANIDNPHRLTAEQLDALKKTGDTTSGPLLLRPGKNAVTDFGNDEAVPRRWVTLFTAPIQALASQVRQAQNGITSQINGLRSRITVLEGRITQRGYIHAQTEPEQEWNINHNLNTQGTSISIYDSEGGMILADVYHIDSNNSRVVFAQPQLGKATVLSVGA